MFLQHHKTGSTARIQYGGHVFLHIKCKIYQHLSLTCLGQHLSKKAICKKKQSSYTFQCFKASTWALLLKVPSKHANTLCHHPQLFTITSSTPAETLLRRSHMPEGRKRHVFVVAVIHQERQACSPQTQCYLRWQSAVEVTISTRRPASVSGPVTPYQVWSICCPLSACQRWVCWGCPPVLSLRQIPCNCDVKGSFYTWTIYLTIWTVIGFVRRHQHLIFSIMNKNPIYLSGLLQ